MASCIRRKPIMTYKSPSADDHAFITLSLTRPGSKQSSSEEPQPEAAPPFPNIHSKTRDPPSWSLPRYSKSASLPLFHPFGRLAMSLPPLDPTRYGLPMLSVEDDVDLRPSSRARRPAAKLREADEDGVASASTTVSAIAAVAAREVKERASPRKRRNGGAKRKRKDPDDGDATYPAKKTRLPRGASGQGVVDEDGPLMGAEPASTNVNESEALSEPGDAAVKRRTTRAKGSVKRRGSSASETASVAGSAKANSENVSGADAGATSKNVDAVVPPSRTSDSHEALVKNVKAEKEEGELSASEDQPNP